MAVETAPTPTPATPKQAETIVRLERATGVPKAQRKDASEMTRQQASEYITALIARTQVDDEDDDTPAPAPAQATSSVGPVLPASQVGPQQFAETKAAMQQLPGTRNETPQGEWPPVPPQSSEAPRRETVTVSSQDVERVDAEALTQSRAAQPQTNRPTPSDNPFDSDGDDDLDLRMGDEEDDDEISAERQTLAPIGNSLGFVIVGTRKIQANNPGWGITAKCIAGPEGTTLGGLAEDAIWHSDNSRWKVDEFLDALHWPPTGNVKRSLLVGKTFWANTEASTDKWTATNANGEPEERTRDRVRIAKYLKSDTLPSVPASMAPSTNGSAPRQRVQATLGSEFDTDKLPL